MQFKLKGHATIKNINIRKQGDDDERESAVDIKFEMESVSAKPLVRMLGAPDFVSMKDTFWLDDKDANIRFSGLTQVTSWAKFEDLKFKIFKHDIRADKTDKFIVTPKSGHMMDITFTVSIKHPDDSLIISLAENLMDSVDITLEDDPGLFDGEDAEIVGVGDAA